MTTYKDVLNIKIPDHLPYEETDRFISDKFPLGIAQKLHDFILVNSGEVNLTVSFVNNGNIAFITEMGRPILIEYGMVVAKVELTFST